MKNINFAEFKTNIDLYFDVVENDKETLIIKRKKGKDLVMISLREYYSIKETLHQLGSRTNTERLFESIQQMKH